MKRYKLGPLHLDIEQRVLYAGSEVVPLSPKSFDILLVLVENAGQVVSRDAIREQVWGDAFIEDANLSNNISMVRSALRPHLGDTQPIKTFSKRGYQLIIPVELEEWQRGDSSAERRAAPTPPAPLPEAARAHSWNTRGNLILIGLFVFGLLTALAFLRTAQAGTLPRHPVASAILASLDHGGAALRNARPYPSLASALIMFGVVAVLSTKGRRRPDLHTGAWIPALLFLATTQIIWTLAREATLRGTLGMLSQILLAFTFAAYKPAKNTLKDSWILYADLLPLLVFVLCCGLDIKKAGVYVVLSAIGRMMLIGSYLLRRDAWVPIGIAILGWICMALLAAAGQYLAAGYTAIAIGSLYAAVNLTIRLPRENIGKPILVAGMLLWTLYAATYPAAFLYPVLHPFWTLVLQLAKLIVCIGMVLFVLNATPDRRTSNLSEELLPA